MYGQDLESRKENFKRFMTECADSEPNFDSVAPILEFELDLKPNMINQEPTKKKAALGSPASTPGLVHQDLDQMKQLTLQVLQDVFSHIRAQHSQYLF